MLHMDIIWISTVLAYLSRWCDSNIVMSLVEERNAKGGRVGDVSCAARTPGVVPAIGVGPPKGGEIT